MRDWSIGINSLYKEGHICIEEAPWYVFFIDTMLDRICHYFPAIPFPAIPMKDDEGNPTTMKDWYGDLAQWMHLTVHIPIFAWCWLHIKQHSISTTYEELRELFYDGNREFFDEEEAGVNGMPEDERTFYRNGWVRKVNYKVFV